MSEPGVSRLNSVKSSATSLQKRAKSQASLAARPALAAEVPSKLPEFGSFAINHLSWVVRFRAFLHAHHSVDSKQRNVTTYRPFLASQLGEGGFAGQHSGLVPSLCYQLAPQNSANAPPKPVEINRRQQTGRRYTANKVAEKYALLYLIPSLYI